MLQERIAITNPVACIGNFCDTDVAASQTDAQLLLAGSGSNNGVVMPRPGYVIGLTGSLSAAASAGSLTVGVTIDGTEDADTTQTITTQQEIRALFTTGAQAVRFAAGQQIGVEITTNSSWDGTTADLGVQVWVVFEGWEY